MNFTPNKNFYYYLYWVNERMNIFWKRKAGQTEDLTEDHIFQQYKFTNVYRSLDRVSQYLIKNVIYDAKGLANDRDTEDIFYRILLFKHFNKIETWQHLESKLGEIGIDTPKAEIEKVLNEYSKAGNVIYSNAFMLTASFMRNPILMEKNNLYVGQPKYSSYLTLFDNSIKNGTMYKILKSQSLKELQENMLSIVAIGKFLSMQYAIDFNYSLLFNFDENDHVIAGPGAERGIERTFDIKGKPDYLKIIRWTHKNLEQEMKKHGFEPKFLPNRKPSMIDCQNVFCEVDKYLRGSDIQTEGKEIEGKRIKNHFSASSEKIDYFFPPKWGVNLK